MKHHDDKVKVVIKHHDDFLSDCATDFREGENETTAPFSCFPPFPPFPPFPLPRSVAPSHRRASTCHSRSQKDDLLLQR